MKKLLFGLLALGSISAFAQNGWEMIPVSECKDTKGPLFTIYQPEFIVHSPNRTRHGLDQYYVFKIAGQNLNGVYPNLGQTELVLVNNMIFANNNMDKRKIVSRLKTKDGSFMALFSTTYAGRVKHFAGELTIMPLKSDDIFAIRSFKCTNIVKK